MALCIGCRIKRVNSLASFKSHFNEECYEYRPVSEPCHHVTYTCVTENSWQLSSVL